MAVRTMGGEGGAESRQRSTVACTPLARPYLSRARRATALCTEKSCRVGKECARIYMQRTLTNRDTLPLYCSSSCTELSTSERAA